MGVAPPAEMGNGASAWWQFGYQAKLITLDEFTQVCYNWLEHIIEELKE